MVKKKVNVGAQVDIEDKELIEKAAKIQRRSIASFIVESAIIRAKEVIKENDII